MPQQNCAICGLRPKKGESGKGYFRVPPDQLEEWKKVIPNEVTFTTRVCFRHWARDDLDFLSGGKVSFKKGRLTSK